MNLWKDTVGGDRSLRRRITLFLSPPPSDWDAAALRREMAEKIGGLAAAEERRAAELAALKADLGRMYQDLERLTAELISLKTARRSDRAETPKAEPPTLPRQVLGTAGSTGQPRLIADDLTRVRNQSLRSTVNWLLQLQAPRGPRKREYSRMASLLTGEIFAAGGGNETRLAAVDRIRNRLLEDGFTAPEQELRARVGKLVEDAAPVRERALDGRAPDALPRSSPGDGFDPERHEAFVGCPDTAGSVVGYSLFPAYRVDGHFFLKELVFTVPQMG